MLGEDGITLSRNRNCHRFLKINILAAGLTESSYRDIHISNNIFLAGSLLIGFTGLSICRSRNRNMRPNE